MGGGWPPRPLCFALTCFFESMPRGRDSGPESFPSHKRSTKALSCGFHPASSPISGVRCMLLQERLKHPSKGGTRDRHQALSLVGLTPFVGQTAARMITMALRCTASWPSALQQLSELKGGSPSALKKLGSSLHSPDAETGAPRGGSPTRGEPARSARVCLCPAPSHLMSGVTSHLT